ncbi:Hypothetical predicted protein [Olea europaea subsp. europaea]|uniref:Ammonium transporter n=1 Tax=Olea europaea subsp. europaea TaxID=158383 RepID=A0A8S0QNJ5_OLEEU|nr:Hypothetical predicted protein [Olea europaea subsp. europaea]
MIFYFKSSVIGTIQGMITILVRVIPTTGHIIKLRMDEDHYLEIGDDAVHGKEAYAL